MEREQKLTKMYKYPELWQIAESVSEVLEIDIMDIFERKRNIIHVQARYFIINFSLIYTTNNLEATAKFLSPAITNHSSVIAGRTKIENDIRLYPEIRSNWIAILQNYKSNKHDPGDNIIKRIDRHVENLISNF